MCHPSPLSRKLPSLGGMQTVEGLQLSAPSGFASAAEEEQPPAKSHPSWADHILSLSQARAQRPRTRLQIGWGFVWLASQFVFSLLLNLVPSPFFSQVLISNKHLASQIPTSILCLQQWQAGFPRIQTARVAAKSWIIHHLAGREDPFTGGGRAQQTLARGNGPVVYWWRVDRVRQSKEGHYQAGALCLLSEGHAGSSSSDRIYGCQEGRVEERDS